MKYSLSSKLPKFLPFMFIAMTCVFPGYHCLKLYGFYAVLNEKALYVQWPCVLMEYNFTCERIRTIIREHC